MTREEEIIKQAEEHAMQYCNPANDDEWGEYTMFKLGFIAGARWANSKMLNEITQR